MLQTSTIHSGVADDDEGGRGRLLAGLELCALVRRLGEDLRRVEVVHAGLEEAGLQPHAQRVLRLQLQLVEGLAHPGEDAVQPDTFRAAEGRSNCQRTAAISSDKTTEWQHCIVKNNNNKCQKKNKQTVTLNQTNSI